MAQRGPAPIGYPARLNPLAVARTDRLPFQWSEGTWQSQLERLQQLQFRGAIIGPHGSGKTTLLEQLRDRLVADGRQCLYLRVPAECMTQSKWFSDCLQRHAGSILLLDSAEQLSSHRRKKLLRESIQGNLGLVVTTHRSGYLPTWVTCRTSLELLHNLLRQLLPVDESDWSRAANEAFQKHHGNIREVFRDLYDQFAVGQFR
jgi:GTPase SAR1 family protein